MGFPMGEYTDCVHVSTYLFHGVYRDDRRVLFEGGIMEKCILFPMVLYSLTDSVYVCVDTSVHRYVGRCACTCACIRVETKGQPWILFFRC